MSLRNIFFSIEYLCYSCVIQFGSTDELYQYVWFALMLLLLYPLWGIVICRGHCLFLRCCGSDSLEAPTPLTHGEVVSSPYFY